MTVDVGCKPATLCAAVGWGFVSTAPEAHRPAGSGRLPKEGPLADASLKREKPTACAVTCLPLCDRVPNSAIEGFFLRRRRRHSAEKLYLLKGEGLLFRVPLAEPDGTLGLPFGSFAFRWRSQRERSVCHSGLSRSAGGARGSARFAIRVFRVPLAKLGGTIGLPFGSFTFCWRSQRERSGRLSGPSPLQGLGPRSLTPPLAHSSPGSSPGANAPDPLAGDGAGMKVMKIHRHLRSHFAFHHGSGDGPGRGQDRRHRPHPAQRTDGWPIWPLQEVSRVHPPA